MKGVKVHHGVPVQAVSVQSGLPVQQIQASTIQGTTVQQALPIQQAVPVQGVPVQQDVPVQGLPVQPGVPINLQQTVINSQPGVFIITNVPKAKKIYENFKGKIAFYLGLVQVICAVLSVIFNGIGWEAATDLNCDGNRYFDDDDETSIFYQSYGYWCSAFYFISGGMAMGTHKIKNKIQPFIRGLLAMSILSFIFGLTQFAALAAAVAITADEDDCFYDSKNPKIMIASGVIMFICGLVVMGTSIWLCKLCGDVLKDNGCSACACCCCDCCKPLPSAIVQYNAGTTPGVGSTQPMVMLPQTNQTGVANPAMGVISAGPVQYGAPTVVHYPQQQGLAATTTVTPGATQTINYPQQQTDASGYAGMNSDLPPTYAAATEERDKETKTGM